MLPIPSLTTLKDWYLTQKLTEHRITPSTTMSNPHHAFQANTPRVVSSQSHRTIGCRCSSSVLNPNEIQQSARPTFQGPLACSFLFDGQIR